MLNNLQQFRENIKRVRTLGGLYEALFQLTAPTVDATDLLRVQIVMAASALDYYIHEITRIGMLEVHRGERPQTSAFLRFEISLNAALVSIDDALKGSAKLHQDGLWLDGEIRRKHGHLSFQQPDKIADAIRLFSDCELWPAVALQLKQQVSDVKSQLKLIIDRRNQIAHETDLNPSQIGSPWPISLADSTNAIDFIEKVCEAIHSVVA